MGPQAARVDRTRANLVETQETRAQAVKVNGEALTVDLVDGRTIIVPLVWFPRLWHGTPRERSHFEVFGEGRYIHWPDLDEDLTVTGLLAGRHSGESLESLGKWLDSRKVAGNKRGSREAHTTVRNAKQKGAR